MSTQLSTREQLPASLFTPTPQAARRMLEFFTETLWIGGVFLELSPHIEPGFLRTFTALTSS